MEGRRFPKRIVPAVVVAAGVVLLVLLWDWNWLRPLVQRQASSALGREVTLQHFDVDLGRHPRLIAEGIAVANPPEFPAGSHLGSIERLAVRVNPWTWFDRKLSLLEIDIEAPRGDLGPGPSGKPNYLFDKLQQPQEKGAAPARELEIGQLRIRDGDIHIVEPALKADFRLRIRTLEADETGESRIRVDAEGRYAGAPISGRFIGGSVLSLRDSARPYPVDLRARNGATEVSLQGSVAQPLRLGGADLQLDLRGADLADLYPLTGVPLPPSPAYRLGGKLDYAGGKIRFRDFSGVVGQSDLSGNVAVDPAGAARRRITVVAASDKVVLNDLAGFIGATPGKPEAPNDTAEQQRQRARKQDAGKLLPDTPLALPRIRAADLDVTYKVARIESEHTPIDKLEGHLVIEDGVITLKPLRLGMGQGSVVANARLDGRQDLVHTVADVDFRKIDLAALMEKITVFRGAGTIGGSARLDAHGNSLAAMLGSGDGEIKLFMTGGDISALLVNLAGLDFGNALISALGLPRRAELRCMVTDFALEDGTMKTRTALFDTTEANILGSGSIDLGKEQIDYEIRTEPKRLNLGRINAPIDIKGPLRDPTIFPDRSQLAARGGAALLLGTVLGPLAALIPTIQLGLGEDNDCVALLRSAEQPRHDQTPAPIKQE